MLYNFDVIFLGGIFPKEKEEIFINNSKGSIQNAANNLQWEFIKGLDDNLIDSVKIINSPYVGSYPKRYKSPKIDTFKFSHDNKSNDINVGFLNITGIKSISRYFSLKPYIKKWSLEKNMRKKVIIAYAMTSPFTHILRYAKKINSDILTCLIVPDLPRLMRTGRQKTMIYSIMKELDIKIISRDMKYIDSYVLLTEHEICIESKITICCN